ncbi:MAG TPA: hypothetical protein VFM37_14480 [Pseudonocardiaceae bacterium]|nr:hypothetical protein [Pseudonocardiaceae bacterium]
MVARKPPALSFEEAGALPLAGLTALQALYAAHTAKDDVVLATTTSSARSAPSR